MDKIEEEPSSCFFFYKNREKQKEKQKSPLFLEEINFKENDIGISENKPTIHIKCVMLGDGSTGKGYASTLFATGVQRDMKTVFDTVYKIIQLNIKTRDYIETDLLIGQKIQLEIADRNGEEEYDDIQPFLWRRRMIHTNANVVLIAVDLLNSDSLENARVKWQAEAKRLMPHCPIVIGAMKEDMWDPDNHKKHIGRKQLLKLASEMKAEVAYCSTFTGKGIEDLFMTILKFGLKHANVSEKEEIDYSQMSLQEKFFLQHINSTSDTESMHILSSLKSGVEYVEYVQNSEFSFKIFYEQLGKNILSYSLQRHFTQSSSKILTDHKSLVPLLLTQIDIATRRTPLMTARAEGLKHLEIEITKVLKNSKEIDPCIGVDKNGQTFSLLLSLVKLNLEYVILLNESRLEGHELDVLATDEEILTSLRKTTSEKVAICLYKELRKRSAKLSTSLEKIKNIHMQPLLHTFVERKMSNLISMVLQGLSIKASWMLLNEKDYENNTPLMHAAVLAEVSPLTSMLTFLLLNTKSEDLDLILHQSNKKSMTLPYLIEHSSEILIAPQGIILQLEKDFHMTGHDEEIGFMKIEECFRLNHGASAETAAALKMLDKSKPMSKPALYFKILLQLFFFGLLLPLSLWSGDVSTDSILCKRYYHDWEHQPYATTSLNITLDHYPEKLSTKAKFFYSLFFIVAPIILQSFAAIQWASERWRGSKVNKTMVLISTPFLVFFWPAFQMIKNFRQQVKSLQARGHDKQTMNKKAVQYEINKSYAHLIEVIVESSFEPLLQWYIVFPGIYSLLQDYSEEEVYSIPEHIRRSLFNERSFRNVLEFSSWLLSLTSLAWSFTAYNSSLKRGAMSPDVNLVGRGLVLLSNFILVFVRMNFIIFFMYSWGPGQFYPGVIAIILHVLVMGSLHVLFVTHEKRPCSSGISSRTRLEILLKIIYSIVINGLANIYCQNFVDSKTEQKSKSFMHKKSTFMRQFIFEIIFLSENILICIIASRSIPVMPFNDSHAKLLIFSLLFSIHFLGLSLKIIYYKFFHIWKDITTVNKLMHSI